jgi:inosose dehydratase
MTKLLIGNAPCSWGMLKFGDLKGEQIPCDRMLDELAESGYTGTKLGWQARFVSLLQTARADLVR